MAHCFYTEITSTISQPSEIWYEFLYLNGDLPSKLSFSKARVIQLIFLNDNPPAEELKEAILNFFQQDTVVLQVATNRFLLIEAMDSSINKRKISLHLFAQLKQIFRSNSFVSRRNL